VSDKITVGAQVSAFINGIRWGQVTGFRFSSVTQHKELLGLDSLEPFEQTPVAVKVNGNVQLIRLVGDGGLEGQGVTTNFEQLPRQKYFTLTLRDNFTDGILFESRYTVVQEQNWEFSAKGIVTGGFTFAGISWNNEVQGH
jgi:hypothetical protein